MQQLDETLLYDRRQSLFICGYLAARRFDFGGIVANHAVAMWPDVDGIAVHHGNGFGVDRLGLEAERRKDRDNGRTSQRETFHAVPPRDRAGDDSPPGYQHPRPTVARPCSNPNPWHNLHGGFSGALMRHALAPQTQFPAALLVERLAVEVEGGRLQDHVSVRPIVTRARVAGIRRR